MKSIKSLTPREMDARTIGRYCAQTGSERANTISYFNGALNGRYGPVSQPAQAWIKRILIAMGELAA